MTADAQTERRPWREVVRRAAEEAAEAAHRFYGDTEEVPFSYRWEHAQAVVRLALRLAGLTGADTEIVE
jgi:HD superfamily phosphodiesterase